MRLAGKLFEPWIRFWQRIEGPELEAPIWHSHFLTARASRVVLPALCARVRGRVVDIGAGTGFAGRFLDSARTRYIPTDLPTGRNPSDTAISQQGQKPKIFCSGYALPLRDASVEGVMAHSVLEHVRHPAAILAEARRVLSDQGRLIVSVPFSFPVHGAPDDFWRWTPEGLRFEIERAGFDVEELVVIGNGVEALAVNLNIFLRYDVTEGSPVLTGILAVLRPIFLVTQLVTNVVALLLAPLDRRHGLPICVGVAATKRAGLADRAG